MHPIERKYFRELRAKPVLKSFKLWLTATKKIAPPKSPLGLAIGYALNQWEYLSNYLKDGRVSICNNWAENQIRPFAIGRKNWGMHTSSRGARSSAVLYSLAITCKARKIDPHEYFLKVLTQAPYCKTRDDWEKLVPG